MNFANNAIESSYNSQIIFIDEVGRLERERKCMYEQVSRLVDETNRMKDKVVILIIREFLLQEILKLLDIKPVKIWILQEKPGEKKVREIYEHCEKIGANKTTVVFLLAMINDKQLTKFHKEFLGKTPHHNEQKGVSKEV